MSVRGSQKITDDIKSRVTEAALQNPKRGPGRLARLLKREGITVSASTIYRILRAEGLHTCEKRSEQAHVMKSEPAAPFTENQPSDDGKPSPAAPPPEQQPVVEILLRSERTRRSRLVGLPGPISWGLRLFQATLVILAMCLGVYAALQFKTMRQQADTIAAVPPADVLQPAPERQTDLRPFQNYRAVWKRDLFGTAAADQTALRKTTALDNLPRAPKDLGLKLVGTAAAEIEGLSMAVIENRKTRSQEPFREGDRIGDLRIKQILRSSVVLVTDAGEVLLAMGDGSGTAGDGDDAGVALADADRTYAIEIARGGEVKETYRTDQKWVTASLGNARQMKRVRFLPQNKSNLPAGLRVRMPTLHVLTRLGLRSYDVIQRINGQEATEPRQAAEAFSRLGKGEDLDIELLRGGEPWRVSVRAS
jgi:type II secretory pathway component PulC